MNLFEELKELQNKINLEISILNEETKEIEKENEKIFISKLESIFSYFTETYLPLIDEELKITIYGVTLVLRPRHLTSGNHCHYCNKETELIRIDVSETNDNFSEIIWSKIGDKYGMEYGLWAYDKYDLKSLVNNFNKYEVDKIVATEITRIMNEKLTKAQADNKAAKGE